MDKGIKYVILFVQESDLQIYTLSQPINSHSDASDV